MKVVILCGGLGSRMGDLTETRPKPMIEIGGKPILWHIMKAYAHYGFNEFVICLGYKGESIKSYFKNYESNSFDFTVKLGTGNTKLHSLNREAEWVVTLAETGLNTKTGARVKRVEKYIDSDIFMLTYGDGVCDLDINKLLEFHLSHGRIGTVTGVSPPSRFGELSVDKGRVLSFNEKLSRSNGLVNGGFFVFKKQFLEYLTADEECVLERAPLEKLATDGELMVFNHPGFWQCMDTPNEERLLDGLWNAGKAPWNVWRD